MSAQRTGFEPAINDPCRLALTLDSGGLFSGGLSNRGISHRGGGGGKYTKISGEVGFCNLTLHLNVSFLGAKKIEMK